MNCTTLETYAKICNLLRTEGTQTIKKQGERKAYAHEMEAEIGERPFRANHKDVSKFNSRWLLFL